MSAFRTLADIKPLPIWNGILARVVEGAEMSFAVVELDAHAVAALHQHPNEQIGVVLQGTLTFKIGDETRTLRVGDTYEIPGNVPHEATAGPRGAVVIERVLAGSRRLAPVPAGRAAHTGLAMTELFSPASSRRTHVEGGQPV